MIAGVRVIVERLQLEDAEGRRGGEGEGVMTCNFHEQKNSEENELQSSSRDNRQVKNRPAMTSQLEKPLHFFTFQRSKKIPSSIFLCQIKVIIAVYTATIEKVVTARMCYIFALTTDADK
jgi:hypothetical protein